MAKRKAPGMSGKGKFYRVEVRPKADFIEFRNQDVGRKGGLERLAGKRRSGSWATVSWLISKEDARVDAHGHLRVDDTKARSVLKHIRGRIVHVKGDVFTAKPRRDVPEREKPTPAMRRAQKINIKKAQNARRGKDAVSALEKDVRADQPDSTQVAADSANVLKHLDDMSKMHDDEKGKKMKM